MNAIAPVVVETPLTEQITADEAWYETYAPTTALGRWSQDSELAGAVVYFASDAASYVIGTILHVDGGWTAIDGRYTPPACRKERHVSGGPLRRVPGFRAFVPEAGPGLRRASALSDAGVGRCFSRSRWLARGA